MGSVEQRPTTPPHNCKIIKVILHTQSVSRQALPNRYGKDA